MAQKKTSTSTKQRAPRRLHSVPTPPASPNNPGSAVTPTSPGKQALLAALDNHPDGQDTAAELAKQAQIGYSTARRVLAELAEQGMVLRIPGAGRGPGRTPARFSLPTGSTEAAPSLAAVPDPSRTDGDSEADSASPTEPDIEEPAADDPATGSGTAQAVHEARASEPGEAIAPDDEHIPDQVRNHQLPAGSSDDTTTGSGTRRLGKNQLRGKVEQYLIEHPDEEFGAHALGRELGHSSGAITNVLARLVKAGYACQTQASPKRFAVNPEI